MENEMMALTVVQVGKVFNVHPNTVRELIAKRGLPSNYYRQEIYHSKTRIAGMV